MASIRSGRSACQPSLRVQVDQWLLRLQHWVLPPACVVCGAPAGSADLCRGCLADLPWNLPACARCARPLDAAALPTPTLCGACSLRLPPWDTALCPLRYRFPVDALLRQVKFSRRLPPARVLGCLMAEWLAASPAETPELLLPVPLHGARLRERGFNQAVELARPIAARLRLPLDASVCRRRRATREQARLATPERRRNVAGAFEILAGLEDAHVAIVDDVITTGSTVGELTRALRAAGAARVDVWGCARA